MNYFLLPYGDTVAKGQLAPGHRCAFIGNKSPCPLLTQQRRRKYCPPQQVQLTLTLASRKISRLILLGNQDEHLEPWRLSLITREDSVTYGHCNDGSRLGNLAPQSLPSPSVPCPMRVHGRCNSYGGSMIGNLPFETRRSRSRPRPERPLDA